MGASHLGRKTRAWKTSGSTHGASTLRFSPPFLLLRPLHGSLFKKVMASRSTMKWFWRCDAVALFLLFLWPPLSSSSEAVATVDVHATKRLVHSGHRYLDVRTVEEFKKGHLENAINVPYLFFTPQQREKNPKFVEQVSLVCDKDDHIVVGCLSGVRSLQAAEDLLNAGFKHVQNMGGGYAAWVENGLPVKKPQEEL